MSLTLNVTTNTINLDSRQPKAIGAAIAEIMAATNYPDDIMAEMLYISEQDLERIKSGQLIPSKNQITEILEHLGCEWSDTQ